MRKKDGFFKKTWKRTVKQASALVLTGSLILGMTPVQINAAAPEEKTSQSSGKAASEYNYATALQKSLIFYELQKSGKLDGAEFNRNNWRGDSCLNDGQDNGVDLTGGWFDAGDHVKFNLPMSYTATTLAWSYLENKEAYDKSGQTKYLKNEVKWANDYFLKCHTKKNVYFFQVGNGEKDHNYWGAAETVDTRMERPSYYVDNTSANGGSAVCGQTAASLAACAMVFKEDDADYAATCIKNAKELLAMGEEAQSDEGYNGPVANFYHSWSGYNDELCWANLWIYKATGEKEYFEKAKTYVSKFNKQGQSSDIEYQYGQSWDDVHYSSCLLIAEEDKSSEEGKLAKKCIENNLEWWVAGANGKSPKGLSWLSEWGSVRYATTSAFLAMMYSQWEGGDADKRETFKNWAKTQAEYALGSSGQCFQVGYKDSVSPRNIHHRTAHGTWLDGLTQEPETSRHLLVGALVGGCKAADDKYTDDRGDFYSNEVACDYNAGFTGLMASMYAANNYTQPEKIDPNAGAYETPDDIPELSIEASINAEDKTNTINFVEIKSVVYNKTAWPARVTDKLSYRFYVDISDAIKNGAKPEDFEVSSNYAMDAENTKLSSLKPYDKENGIYYTEIDLSGIKIYPGGQNYYRNEVQFRIKAPGKWDYSNSPSLKGLKTGNTAITLAENMTLYDNGKLVFGTEPDGKTPDITTTERPATTQKPATTQSVTTTQKPATTQSVTTTQKPATTQSVTTTQKPATTQRPATTENSTTEAKQDTNDDWLHVSGSDIVDDNGNVVRLTGANWFGFNCCEALLHGLGWGADIRKVIKEAADRGINLLRIPVSTELLIDWRDGVAIGKKTNFSNSKDYKDNPDLVNEDGTSMNNLQVFDKMMEICKEYGVKVMVDVHSPHANNSGHNYELWYGETSSTTGKEITTEDFIEGWKWLVNRYKNDDTLIACDLENEPHGKRDGGRYAKWDDSTDENNWRYAAIKCSEEILKINPNLLIMVEGVEQTPKAGHSYSEEAQKNVNSEYLNYDGGWWGGNLRLAGEYPVEFASNPKWNQQIVYSPHDYGPKVYAQEWFNKDFTEQTLLDDYWYDSWAYLVEENKAPLLMGEWGGFMDGGDNEKWMNLLAEYMNKKNISHTFWCINPNSGDTGGLLKDDWKSWDEEKYALFEKTTWKSESGKYVGLDHQKALGENGITIDEFYDGNPSTKVEVTGVELDKNTLKLKAGETGTLKETVSPSNATNKRVAWTSDNEAVATVENGIVTAKKAGTANITVKTADGNKTAVCKVTVEGQIEEPSTETPSTTAQAPTTQVPTPTTQAPTPTTQAPTPTTQAPTPTTEVPNKDKKVESVSLNKHQLTLKVDEKETLKATILPEDATNKNVTWSSSSPEIASVENGVVTAKKVGTVKITVKTEDGSYKDSCEVTVTDKNVSVKSITLNKLTTTIVEGETEKLTATITPENATNKNITWKSSNTDVATVENGVITAKNPGTAIITVVAEDNNTTADCEVIVTKKGVDPVAVTGVQLNLNKLSLYEGEDATLIPTVSPKEATNKEVTWKSDNEKVATVDKNGKVTALSEGTAIITVKTEDGNKTAKCSVEVKKKAATDIPVESISVIPSAITLVKGNSESLRIQIEPINATDKTVEWKSNNEDVVVVDDGIITAVAPGETTVIVTTKNGITGTCKVTVKDDQEEVKEPQRVILNETSINLKEGESKKLTATVEPEEFANDTLKWTSNNSSAVSVDKAGVVTAKIAGVKVIITVATSNGKIADCEVTVSPKEEENTEIQSIILNTSKLELYEGEDAVLNPTIKPDSADQTVIWKTSDSSVATVENGKVVAVAEGTVEITAIANNGMQAKCEVTVKKEAENGETDISVTGISFIKNMFDMQVGEKPINLSEFVSIKPDNATNKEVEWVSSDPDIATITNGYVTAKKKGSAVITVTTKNGKTAKCTIVVSQPVESVVVNGGKMLELESGDVKLVKTVINPEDASVTEIEWKSKDETVATVENGIIRAKKAGTTIITATVGGVTGEVRVVVKEKTKPTTTPTTEGNNSSVQNQNPSSSSNITNPVSQQQNITKPLKVTKLKKKVLKKIVKLSWKKQKDVTGYQIFKYDSKKKKYVVYKVVKSNKASAVLKKLKRHSKYKFKVRAYKTVNDTTVYGSYSKALTVKTK